MPRPVPIEERLLRNLVLDGSCWIWTAKVHKRTGYGMIAVENQRKALAHRVAFETWVGPIPKGLTIDHLCANRRCINPGHMEPVTLRENILRGNNMAARNARKTHCPKGHPYTEGNIYQRRNGGRICRACALARRRRDYARAKGGTF